MSAVLATLCLPIGPSRVITASLLACRVCELPDRRMIELTTELAHSLQDGFFADACYPSTLSVVGCVGVLSQHLAVDVHSGSYERFRHKCTQSPLLVQSANGSWQSSWIAPHVELLVGTFSWFWVHFISRAFFILPLLLRDSPVFTRTFLGTFLRWNEVMNFKYTNVN